MYDTNFDGIHTPKPIELLNSYNTNKIGTDLVFIKLKFSCVMSKYYRNPMHLSYR